MGDQSVYGMTGSLASIIYCASDSMLDLYSYKSGSLYLQRKQPHRDGQGDLLPSQILHLFLLFSEPSPVMSCPRSRSI